MGKNALGVPFQVRRGSLVPAATNSSVMLGATSVRPGDDGPVAASRSRDDLEVVKVECLLKGGPLDERLIEVDDDLLARIDVEDAAGQSHPYCKIGVERPSGQRTEPLAIYVYEPELEAS